jgi:hypothetical protein
MRGAPRLLLLGITICVLGLRPVGAQEATKAEKPQIPGGIEGHVKSVDVDKETITIVTTAGTQRTFSVTEDTIMLGPRGGKVRRGLHDPRFHEGMSLTVVPTGTSAKEVHLGYRHREPGETKASGKKAAAARAETDTQPAGTAPSKPASKTKATTTKDSAAATKSAATDEEDEDDEIPGTVRSYNADRRILVVSLLNGTHRTFFLSRDLKVVTRGATSKQGTADPALKEGAHVVVFTDEGGRRVKELHVNPMPATRKKKKAA